MITRAMMFPPPATTWFKGWLGDCPAPADGSMSQHKKGAFGSLVKALVRLVALFGGCQDLLDDWPTRRLERLERARDGAGRFHRAMQRDGVLQREPGPRSDAEVHAAQRIAYEHDIAMRPALVREHVEGRPGGLVRQQRLPLQVGREDPFAVRAALSITHRPESAPCPRAGVALDDEG